MPRLFVIRGKRMSEFGADAKRRKEIRGNTSATDDLRALAIRFGEEASVFLVGGDGLEGVILPLPVEEVGIGGADGPVGIEFVGRCSGRKLHRVNRDQAIGMGKWQWANQYS